MKKTSKYLLIAVICLAVVFIGIGVYLASNKPQDHGQTDQTQTLLSGERELLEMLRLWAKENDGKFPDELTPAALEALYERPFAEYDKLEKELMPRILERDARRQEIEAQLYRPTGEPPDVNEIRAMSREQIMQVKEMLARDTQLMDELQELDRLDYEDEAKLRLASDKPVPSFEEMMKFDLAMGLGMRFVLSLRAANDWHYSGMNVSLGDAGTAIFWYKPKVNEDRYRVVYGDLRIQDTTTDNLAHLSE